MSNRRVRIALLLALACLTAVLGAAAVLFRAAAHDAAFLQGFTSVGAVTARNCAGLPTQQRYGDPTCRTSLVSSRSGSLAARLDRDAKLAAILGVIAAFTLVVVGLSALTGPGRRVSTTQAPESSDAVEPDTGAQTDV
jgi:hypothetical protein